VRWSALHRWAGSHVESAAAGQSVWIDAPRSTEQHDLLLTTPTDQPTLPYPPPPPPHPPPKGARSTAGREGPVLGRPVRRGGSRPLLIAEVQEHWASDVRAACLVRWSREGGGPDSNSTTAAEALLLELRGRYLAALAAYPNLDETAPSSPDEQQRGSREAESDSSATRQAGEGQWAALRPRDRVVDAINSSRVAVRVVSSYPPHITAAALQRAGVQAAAGSGSGSSGVMVVQAKSLEIAAVAAAEAAAAVEGAVLHVVVDRLGRAERLRELLRQRWAAATASVAAAAAAAAATTNNNNLTSSSRVHKTGGSGSGSSGSGSGSGSSGLQRPPPEVYVADWCCITASQRAAAGTALLSDHRMAELLGCADLPLVMDGVAWR
jgi:hypothetical protein